MPDDHTAVCTPSGTVYDHGAILNWLAKHNKNKTPNNAGSSSSLSSSTPANPVDPNGPPLRAADLIRLNFTRNDDNEIVDPVTYRPFTQGTRVVALRPTGNVFARETVERLNVKAKHWQDLVSDEPFTRADIIGLQEEQNRQDGNSKGEKVEKAKEAVARARAERENKQLSGAGTGKSITSSTTSSSHGTKSNSSAVKPKSLPYNAAIHTTGKAAASFTSTGLTPHTSNERAILTDEEYMLRPRRVKAKGYARIATNIGDLSVELQPEYAPKAVWNFVQLAKKGYYKDVIFHRNIKGFMVRACVSKLRVFVNLAYIFKTESPSLLPVSHPVFPTQRHTSMHNETNRNVKTHRSKPATRPAPVAAAPPSGTSPSPTSSTGP